MALYPVNLDLRGRKCLVIGGGNVARRKVSGLHGAGASVHIISPQLVPELLVMVKQGDIRWSARAFASGDLQGAFLVFAATDVPAVQRQVQQEAEAAGILVNMASASAGSNFHVPGHFRSGDLLVTVSTGGKSPAIAAKLRRDLEKKLSPAYSEVVSFFAMLRENVLRLDTDSAKHAQLFHSLLAAGIVERILAGEWDVVSSLLESSLPEEIDSRRLVDEFVAKRHDAPPADFHCCESKK